jgi:hypothetical protein
MTAALIPLPRPSARRWGLWVVTHDRPEGFWWNHIHGSCERDDTPMTFIAGSHRETPPREAGPACSFSVRGNPWAKEPESPGPTIRGTPGAVGHRRRGERATVAPDGSRLGSLDPGSVPRGWSAILLQAERRVSGRDRCGSRRCDPRCIPGNPLTPGDQPMSKRTRKLVAHADAFIPAVHEA